MVTETGRLVDELVTNHVEAVTTIEVERAIACACPDVSRVPLPRALDAGAQEMSSDAAPLEMFGDGHPAELYGKR